MIEEANLMDAVGIGAVLTGAAALIGAIAQLIRELRRDKPSQPSQDPTSPE